jgi:hypothetical protein
MCLETRLVCRDLVRSVIERASVCDLVVVTRASVQMYDYETEF